MVPHQHWCQLLSAEAVDEALALDQEGVVNVVAVAGVQEGLHIGHGYNIYYAFLVKCKRFMDRFGKEKLTPMLVRDKD